MWWMSPITRSVAPVSSTRRTRSGEPPRTARSFTRSPAFVTLSSTKPSTWWLGSRSTSASAIRRPDWPIPTTIVRRWKVECRNTSAKARRHRTRRPAVRVSCCNSTSRVAGSGGERRGISM